jgi:hypothetical protein
MVRVIAKATDFVLIATLDFVIGLGWLCLAPHRTASEFYNPAKQVLAFTDSPMRWWGATLIVLAIIKYIGLRYDRRVLPSISFCLGLFWSWWFTVTIIYFSHGDGNLLGPALTFGFLWRHFALWFTTNSRRIHSFRRFTQGL